MFVLCTSGLSYYCVFFFFNDTATTEIYTLSLHDALRSNPLCCPFIGTSKHHLSIYFLGRATNKLMMKTRVFKLLRSLLGTLKDLSLSQHQIMLIAERYNDNIEKKILNEGKVTSVKHFKEIYLFCRNISLEIDLPAPLPFVATDKKGVPKVIKPLIPLLTGTTDDRRIGMTIARFYESIYCDAKPDVTSIIEETSGTVVNDKFHKFIETKVPKIVRRHFAPDNFKIVCRQVKGPNGPAMLTSHYDAVALKQKGILDNLNKLSNILPK